MPQKKTLQEILEEERKKSTLPQPQKPVFTSEAERFRQSMERAGVKLPKTVKPEDLFKPTPEQLKINIAKKKSAEDRAKFVDPTKNPDLLKANSLSEQILDLNSQIQALTASQDNAKTYKELEGIQKRIDFLTAQKTKTVQDRASVYDKFLREDAIYHRENTYNKSYNDLVRLNSTMQFEMTDAEREIASKKDPKEAQHGVDLWRKRLEGYAWKAQDEIQAPVLGRIIEIENLLKNKKNVMSQDVQAELKKELEGLNKFAEQLTETTSYLWNVSSEASKSYTPYEIYQKNLADEKFRRRRNNRGIVKRALNDMAEGVNTVLVGGLGAIEATGLKNIGAINFTAMRKYLEEGGKEIAIHPDDRNLADQGLVMVGYMLPTFMAAPIAAEAAGAAGLSLGMSRWIGAGTNAAMQATVNAGDTYIWATEQQKLSHEEAQKMAAKNFGSDLVVTTLMGRLGDFADPRLASGIKKAMWNMPVEGLEEMAQQVDQNVSRGQKWDTGVYESGKMGFIFGGLFATPGIVTDVLLGDKDVKSLSPEDATKMRDQMISYFEENDFVQPEERQVGGIPNINDLVHDQFVPADKPSLGAEIVTHREIAERVHGLTWEEYVPQLNELRGVPERYNSPDQLFILDTKTNRYTPIDRKYKGTVEDWEESYNRLAPYVANILDSARKGGELSVPFDEVLEALNLDMNLAVSRSTLEKMFNKFEEFNYSPDTDTVHTKYDPIVYPAQDFMFMSGTEKLAAVQNVIQGFEFNETVRPEDVASLLDSLDYKGFDEGWVKDHLFLKPDGTIDVEKTQVLNGAAAQLAAGLRAAGNLELFPGGLEDLIDRSVEHFVQTMGEEYRNEASLSDVLASIPQVIRQMDQPLGEGSSFSIDAGKYFQLDNLDLHNLDKQEMVEAVRLYDAFWSALEPRVDENGNITVPRRGLDDLFPPDQDYAAQRFQDINKELPRQWEAMLSDPSIKNVQAVAASTWKLGIRSFNTAWELFVQWAGTRLLDPIKAKIFPEYKAAYDEITNRLKGQVIEGRQYGQAPDGDFSLAPEIETEVKSSTPVQAVGVGLGSVAGFAVGHTVGGPIGAGIGTSVGGVGGMMVADRLSRRQVPKKKYQHVFNQPEYRIAKGQEAISRMIENLEKRLPKEAKEVQPAIRARIAQLEAMKGKSRNGIKRTILGASFPMDLADLNSMGDAQLKTLSRAMQDIYNMFVSLFPELDYTVNSVAYDVSMFDSTFDPVTGRMVIGLRDRKSLDSIMEAVAHEVRHAMGYEGGSPEKNGIVNYFLFNKGESLARLQSQGVSKNWELLAAFMQGVNENTNVLAAESGMREGMFQLQDILSQIEGYNYNPDLEKQVTYSWKNVPLNVKDIWDKMRYYLTDDLIKLREFEQEVAKDLGVKVKDLPEFYRAETMANLASRANTVVRSIIEKGVVDPDTANQMGWLNPVPVGTPRVVQQGQPTPPVFGGAVTPNSARKLMPIKRLVKEVAIELGYDNWTKMWDIVMKGHDSQTNPRIFAGPQASTAATVGFGHLNDGFALNNTARADLKTEGFTDEQIAQFMVFSTELEANIQAVKEMTGIPKDMMMVDLFQDISSDPALDLYWVGNVTDPIVKAQRFVDLAVRNKMATDVYRAVFNGIANPDTGAGSIEGLVSMEEDTKDKTGVPEADVPALFKWNISIDPSDIAVSPRRRAFSDKDVVREGPNAIWIDGKTYKVTMHPLFYRAIEKVTPKHVNSFVKFLQKMSTFFKQGTTGNPLFAPVGLVMDWVQAEVNQGFDGMSAIYHGIWGKSGIDIGGRNLSMKELDALFEQVGGKQAMNRVRDAVPQDFYFDKEVGARIHNNWLSNILMGTIDNKTAKKAIDLVFNKGAEGIGKAWAIGDHTENFVRLHMFRQLVKERLAEWDAAEKAGDTEKIDRLLDRYYLPAPSVVTPGTLRDPSQRANTINTLLTADPTNPQVGLDAMNLPQVRDLLGETETKEGFRSRVDVEGIAKGAKVPQPNPKEAVRSVALRGILQSAARDTGDLMNFARSGVFLREGSRMIPYLNIPFQGYDAIKKGFKREPARWIAAAMFALVIPKILEGIAWGDDEDYANLPDYVKDTSIVLYKQSDGDFITMPISPEFGAMFLKPAREWGLENIPQANRTPVHQQNLLLEGTEEGKSKLPLLDQETKEMLTGLVGEFLPKPNLPPFVAAITSVRQKAATDEELDLIWNRYVREREYGEETALSGDLAADFNNWVLEKLGKEGAKVSKSDRFGEYLVQSIFGTYTVQLEKNLENLLGNTSAKDINIAGRPLGRDFGSDWEKLLFKRFIQEHRGGSAIMGPGGSIKVPGFTAPETTSAPDLNEIIKNIRGRLDETSPMPSNK